MAGSIRRLDSAPPDGLEFQSIRRSLVVSGWFKSGPDLSMLRQRR